MAARRHAPDAIRIPPMGKQDQGKVTNEFQNKSVILAIPGSSLTPASPRGRGAVFWTIRSCWLSAFFLENKRIYKGSCSHKRIPLSLWERPG
jgi:hypothetical protein